LIFWDVKDEDVKNWAMKYIFKPLNVMGISVCCYKVIHSSSFNIGTK
jgi:hypothetical protein